MGARCGGRNGGRKGRGEIAAVDEIGREVRGRGVRRGTSGISDLGEDEIAGNGVSASEGDGMGSAGIRRGFLLEGGESGDIRSAIRGRRANSRRGGRDLGQGGGEVIENSSIDVIPNKFADRRRGRGICRGSDRGVEIRSNSMVEVEIGGRRSNRTRRGSVVVKHDEGNGNGFSVGGRELRSRRGLSGCVKIRGNTIVEYERGELRSGRIRGPKVFLPGEGEGDGGTARGRGMIGGRGLGRGEVVVANGSLNGGGSRDGAAVRGRGRGIGIGLGRGGGVAVRRIRSPRPARRFGWVPEDRSAGRLRNSGGGQGSVRRTGMTLVGPPIKFDDDDDHNEVNVVVNAGGSGQRGRGRGFRVGQHENVVVVGLKGQRRGNRRRTGRIASTNAADEYLDLVSDNGVVNEIAEVREETQPPSSDNGDHA